MAEKSIDLKVADPDPTHVGRNIVTLDRESKRYLGITSGDIVEVEGTKKTAAIVWPARANDEGKLLIRMDSFIRHNSGVGLGERVTVRRAIPKEAKKVVLAPTQEIRIIASGYDRILKKNFLGRPLTIGDSVWISVFGSGFVYKVIDTTPRGTVKVTDFTQIVLKEKPAKGELEAIPRVSYDDIGGLDEPIRKVREMVELPMRHPELFRKLGIVPPKGVLLFGPPGCITGESLIALEDGRLVRIKELASNLLPGIHVADLPIYPPAHAKAIHVYDVPETIELLTESGKRLRMTLNHPLMSESGWKKAEGLLVGEKIKTFDWIPSPDSYVRVHFELNEKKLHKKPKIPKIFDEELGFILGVFVAEGSFELGRIKFTVHKNEKEFAEAIISKAISLFGVKHTDFYDKHKNVRKIRFANRGLSDFFKQFWDKQKRVPSEILMSPNSVAAAFLKGLFEGDGSVVKKDHHFNRAITLKSHSRQLVEEVQTLLLRWSIKSSVYTYPTKWAPSNILKIAGRTNLERFYSSIGFVSKNKLGKLRHHLSTYSRKYSTAPKQFEKIKEIRRVKGWQRVYDFEVPTTHSFFSNGILSHNTGKTLLAKAVANETQAHFISVNAPAVMSKFVGEAEERIRQMFKEAEENAPSIIFIDEIDAIAPKRETVIGEVERRVVAQILALMDGLEARGNVIVIAATNRVNSLDEALRRPGRFDREIEFPVPSKRARKEILLIHTRGMPVAKDVDLDYFASITHGFVGADLAALAKEAAMKALRRYLPEIDLEEEEIPQEILESLEVNRKDFQNGLKDVQPSALREVAIEIPNVKWAEIGNLEEAKDELRQVIEWPLRHPESFKKMGIRPPSGVLLFGPPGCGKTLLAKAVASESEANFISVKGPELLSMWIGESEKGIRKVFRKARQVSPCIVFFDEIDSIASRRGTDVGSHATERVVNQLLTELDGIEQNRGVVFLAATNRPDLLDPGLMRPGRIDKLVRVDAPDKKGRMAIFKVHTKNVLLDKNVSLRELVEKTTGFSGADIAGLIRTAALIALKESRMKPTPVSKRNFEKALAKVKASVTPKVEEAYEEIEEHLGEFKPSYVG